MEKFNLHGTTDATKRTFLKRVYISSVRKST